MQKHLVTSDKFPHLGGNILEGDDATWEPDLWTWLVYTFSVKSVLDVGCGCGFSTNWFRKQGVVGIGLDGLTENILACGNPAYLCDISKPLPSFLPKVDLVWCCEVVEHIDEKFIDNLLRVLSLGRVVAMTHAGIGQGGYHHVNCRPSSYWIEKMKEAGFDYLCQHTEGGRNLCEDSHHFAQRGLIFGKEKS